MKEVTGGWDANLIINSGEYARGVIHFRKSYLIKLDITLV
jgi:hypothetical protein